MIDRKMYKSSPHRLEMGHRVIYVPTSDAAFNNAIERNRLNRALSSIGVTSPSNHPHHGRSLTSLRSTPFPVPMAKDLRS